MSIPLEIEIHDGDNGKRKYHYWREFDSFEEARYYGKKMKEKGMKYFILKSRDSWFLPVPVYALYFNKKKK